MALHNSLHTGSVARAVLTAQDARLALAGLLALNGPGPLDVRAGIMYAPGSPGNVTGDASTGPWRYTVAPGSFVTTKGNLDGPHLSTNDAPTLVSTIAPPGSNSRYDLIYAMQKDADATISPDATTVPLLGVVNGVAQAVPAVPATPAGAIALATALVLSTATLGTSGPGVTINTAVSRYTTTRNDPIPVRNATERAEITAYDGASVYRLDLHLVETYNGTAWIGALARYRGTIPAAGTVIAASTSINFATVEDTAAGWNASTKSWTAPVAGTYLINAMIKNGASGVAGLYIIIDDGAGGILATSSTFANQAFGGGTLTRYLRLAAGAAIRMYTGAGYTTADTSTTNNYLEIIQVAF